MYNHKNDYKNDFKFINYKLPIPSSSSTLHMCFKYSRTRSHSTITTTLPTFR
jgi:hypothetical protein